MPEHSADREDDRGSQPECSLDSTETHSAASQLTLGCQAGAGIESQLHRDVANVWLIGHNDAQATARLSMAVRIIG